MDREPIKRPRWFLFLAAIALFAAYLYFARDVTIAEPDLLSQVLATLAGLLAIVCGLLGGGPPMQDALAKFTAFIGSLRRRG
ncbi:MAG: hypothetical protein KI792_12720 [Alphaproteobacteria bacterium]|nr:hypothetical protein [Alphaproteobacteria bacterium SS10]